jgi:hypothetical protein
VLILPVMLIASWIHAQQYDSTRYLSEEDEVMLDTSIGPPAVTDEEEYTEDAAEEDSKFFMKRTDQANGGGPENLQTRKLPDSLVNKLKKDGDFWYVNYPFGNKPEENAGKNGSSDTPLTETPLFQTILWLAIIGGFAAFVIIYLSNSNVSLFRKKSRIISSGEEAEMATDNIFEINYQKEIDKAVSRGNYRFAVRLMFLRVLKNLSEKNVIQYKPDRTNFDYLLQLQPTKHYNEFFRITRNYEYSWYGLFDIDQEKFSLIKNDFDHFDNKLKY